MSSIKNISASNPVPNDLAKRLGNDGIGVILATLWLGYMFIVKYKCRKLQTKNVGRCNYIL